jgi:hypothetical protein
MTRGVIPVRHSSLPGLVKLPRRYEKAALGDPRTAKHRKVSICAGPLTETLSARMDDLTTAIVWVKQELILLRQHDILLKHQFFNIHDSIQSFHTKETTKPSSSSVPTSNSIITNGEFKDHSPSVQRLSCTTSESPLTPACSKTTTSPNLPHVYSDYQLETFLVRPSASVSLLHSKNDESAESDDDDDTFVDKYYRPRTSSMRTTRDMAALARRRGSKDLI